MCPRVIFDSCLLLFAASDLSAFNFLKPKPDEFRYHLLTPYAWNPGGGAGRPAGGGKPKPGGGANPEGGPPCGGGKPGGGLLKPGGKKPCGPP
jgi:hypothetical protein